MSKRKKLEPVYSFEGKQLHKLDECTPFCAIFSEEKKQFEELKEYLKKHSLTVLCSEYGWDKFLNSTLLTGNVPNFINYLDDFVKHFPSEIYHLTDSGDLKTATIEKR